MLRTSDKRLHIGERLPLIFGGRGALRITDYKPPRLDGPQRPPVANPAVWYDPSDLASVTHVAGKISALADKSGNGYTMTSSAGQIYLGVPPGSKVGRPVMFTAGDIFNSTSPLPGDMSATHFVVGCVHELSHYHNLLGHNGGGGNLSFRVNQTTGQLETDKSGQAVLGVQSNAAVTAGVPFVACSAIAASTVTHYLNFVSETDNHGQSFNGGGALRIGADSSSSNFHGWFGEIVCYDTTLTSGQIEETIGYLMSKWGI